MASSIHTSHETRFSDSSIYDEICMKCGATDARDDNRLYEPCPGNTGAKIMPGHPVGPNGPAPSDFSKHVYDDLPPAFKTLDQGLQRGLITGTATGLLALIAGEYRKATKAVNENAQIIDEQAEEIQRLQQHSEAEAYKKLNELSTTQLMHVITMRIDECLTELKAQHIAQKPFDIVPPPGYFCYSHAKSLMEAAVRFANVAETDDEAAAAPDKK